MAGCILIFANAHVALCISSEPVVYVAGDGSGDFNCDGKDDHIQINEALTFVAENSAYTTVHLEGPFTYVIDDTLLIGSNTILEGDSSAVIKLVDDAGWPAYKGIIQPREESAHEITIQGFEIDGNDANQPVSNGECYYTVMLLDGCTNVTVRNMYVHDSNNDGVRVLNRVYTEGSGNIDIYNNRFYCCCHNSVYLAKVSSANIHNNAFIPFSNDGITITDSNHISIHDNTIDPGISTGGCGIQIQKAASIPAMDNIEIYGNNISNTNLAGVLVHGYNSYPVPSGAQNVYIHHNIISGCGQHMGLSTYFGGGINVQGFSNTTIENNLIDGCYHDGISMKNVWLMPPKYMYKTIIRDNVVTNTLPGRLISGSGHGISIYDTSMYTVSLENNDVWNNGAGNYLNV
ncbi:right-handed parallel beta-helix repeat-containing protein [Methanosarcina horonobensis]|uniref:right-handed parallel beta-helix repeat-containing protein n=1 Tax=Methanosarcina horonobensis TaxID=418008 RepID=UPI000B2DFE51|nr:right-handed parallel beta-helix repeat-containing protein [Methanosarcina horonobensis]